MCYEKESEFHQGYPGTFIEPGALSGNLGSQGVSSGGFESARAYPVKRVETGRIDSESIRARINPSAVFQPSPAQDLDFPAGTFVIDKESLERGVEGIVLVALSYGADEALKNSGYIYSHEYEQFGVVVRPAHLAGYVLTISEDTHEKLDGPQLFDRMVEVLRSAVSGLQAAGFEVKDPLTLQAEKTGQNKVYRVDGVTGPSLPSDYDNYDY